MTIDGKVAVAAALSVGALPAASGSRRRAATGPDTDQGRQRQTLPYSSVDECALRECPASSRGGTLRRVVRADARSLVARARGARTCA